MKRKEPKPFLRYLVDEKRLVLIRPRRRKRRDTSQQNSEVTSVADIPENSVQKLDEVASVSDNARKSQQKPDDVARKSVKKLDEVASVSDNARKSQQKPDDVARKSVKKPDDVASVSDNARKSQQKPDDVARKSVKKLDDVARVSDNARKSQQKPDNVARKSHQKPDNVARKSQQKLDDVASGSDKARKSQQKLDDVASVSDNARKSQQKPDYVARKSQQKPEDVASVSDKARKSQQKLDDIARKSQQKLDDVASVSDNARKSQQKPDDVASVSDKTRKSQQKLDDVASVSDNARKSQQKPDDVARKSQQKPDDVASVSDNARKSQQKPDYVARKSQQKPDDVASVSDNARKSQQKLDDVARKSQQKPDDVASVSDNARKSQQKPDDVARKSQQKPDDVARKSQQKPDNVARKSQQKLDDVASGSEKARKSVQKLDEVTSVSDKARKSQQKPDDVASVSDNARKSQQKPDYVARKSQQKPDDVASVSDNARKSQQKLDDVARKSQQKPDDVASVSDNARKSQQKPDDVARKSQQKPDDLDDVASVSDNARKSQQKPDDVARKSQQKPDDVARKSQQKPDDVASVSNKLRKSQQKLDDVASVSDKAPKHQQKPTDVTSVSDKARKSQQMLVEVAIISEKPIKRPKKSGARTSDITDTMLQNSDNVFNVSAKPIKNGQKPDMAQIVSDKPSRRPQSSDEVQNISDEHNARPQNSDELPNVSAKPSTKPLNSDKGQSVSGKHNTRPQNSDKVESISGKPDPRPQNTDDKAASDQTGTILQKDSHHTFRVEHWNKLICSSQDNRKRDEDNQIQSSQKKSRQCTQNDSVTTGKPAEHLHVGTDSVVSCEAQSNRSVHTQAADVPKRQGPHQIEHPGVRTKEAASVSGNKHQKRLSGEGKAKVDMITQSSVSLIKHGGQSNHGKSETRHRDSCENLSSINSPSVSYQSISSGDGQKDSFELSHKNHHLSNSESPHHIALETKGDLLADNRVSRDNHSVCDQKKHAARCEISLSPFNPDESKWERAEIKLTSLELNTHNLAGESPPQPKRKDRVCFTGEKSMQELKHVMKNGVNKSTRKQSRIIQKMSEEKTAKHLENIHKSQGSWRKSESTYHTPNPDNSVFELLHAKQPIFVSKGREDCVTQHGAFASKAQKYDPTGDVSTEQCTDKTAEPYSVSNLGVSTIPHRKCDHQTDTLSQEKLQIPSRSGCGSMSMKSSKGCHEMQEVETLSKMVPVISNIKHISGTSETHIRDSHESSKYSVKTSQSAISHKSNVETSERMLRDTELTDSFPTERCDVLADAVTSWHKETATQYCKSADKDVSLIGSTQKHKKGSGVDSPVLPLQGKRPTSIQYGEGTIGTHPVQELHTSTNAEVQACEIVNRQTANVEEQQSSQANEYSDMRTEMTASIAGSKQTRLSNDRKAEIDKIIPSSCPLMISQKQSHQKASNEKKSFDNTPSSLLLTTSEEHCPQIVRKEKQCFDIPSTSKTENHLQFVTPPAKRHLHWMSGSDKDKISELTKRQKRLPDNVPEPTAGDKVLSQQNCEKHRNLAESELRHKGTMEPCEDKVSCYPDRNLHCKDSVDHKTNPEDTREVHGFAVLSSSNKKGGYVGLTGKLRSVVQKPVSPSTPLAVPIIKFSKAVRYSDPSKPENRHGKGSVQGRSGRTPKKKRHHSSRSSRSFLHDEQEGDRYERKYDFLSSNYRAAEADQRHLKEDTGRSRSENRSSERGPRTPASKRHRSSTQESVRQHGQESSHSHRDRHDSDYSRSPKKRSHRHDSCRSGHREDSVRSHSHRRHSVKKGDHCKISSRCLEKSTSSRKARSRSRCLEEQFYKNERSPSRWLEEQFYKNERSPSRWLQEQFYRNERSPSGWLEELFYRNEISTNRWLEDQFYRNKRSPSRWLEDQSYGHERSPRKPAESNMSQGCSNMKDENIVQASPRHQSEDSSSKPRAERRHCNIILKKMPQSEKSRKCSNTDLREKLNNLRNKSPLGLRETEGGELQFTGNGDNSYETPRQREDHSEHLRWDKIVTSTTIRDEQVKGSFTEASASDSQDQDSDFCINSDLDANTAVCERIGEESCISSASAVKVKLDKNMQTHPSVPKTLHMINEPFKAGARKHRNSKKEKSSGLKLLLSILTKATSTVLPYAKASGNADCVNGNLEYTEPESWDYYDTCGKHRHTSGDDGGLEAKRDASCVCVGNRQLSSVPNRCAFSAGTSAEATTGEQQMTEVYNHNMNYLKLNVIDPQIAPNVSDESTISKKLVSEQERLLHTNTLPLYDANDRGQQSLSEAGHVSMHHKERTDGTDHCVVSVDRSQHRIESEDGSRPSEHRCASVDGPQPTDHSVLEHMPQHRFESEDGSRPTEHCVLSVDRSQPTERPTTVSIRNGNDNFERPHQQSGDKVHQGHSKFSKQVPDNIDQENISFNNTEVVQHHIREIYCGAVHDFRSLEDNELSDTDPSHVASKDVVTSGLDQEDKSPYNVVLEDISSPSETDAQSQDEVHPNCDPIDQNKYYEWISSEENSQSCGDEQRPDCFSSNDTRAPSQTVEEVIKTVGESHSEDVFCLKSLSFDSSAMQASDGINQLYENHSLSETRVMSCVNDKDQFLKSESFKCLRSSPEWISGVENEKDVPIQFDISKEKHVLLDLPSEQTAQPLLGTYFGNVPENECESNLSMRKAPEISTEPSADTDAAETSKLGDETGNFSKAESYPSNSLTGKEECLLRYNLEWQDAKQIVPEQVTDETESLSKDDEVFNKSQNGNDKHPKEATVECNRVEACEESEVHDEQAVTEDKPADSDCDETITFKSDTDKIDSSNKGKLSDTVHTQKINGKSVGNTCEKEKLPSLPAIQLEKDALICKLNENIQVKIEPLEDYSSSSEDVREEPRFGNKQEPSEENSNEVQHCKNALLNVQDIKLEENCDQGHGKLYEDANSQSIIPKQEQSDDEQAKEDQSDQKQSEQNSFCSEQEEYCHESEGVCADDVSVASSDPESDSDEDLPSFQHFLGLHPGGDSDSKDSSKKLPLKSHHGHMDIKIANALNNLRETTSTPSKDSMDVKTEIVEEDGCGQPLEIIQHSTKDAEGRAPSADHHQLNHLVKQEQCLETFNTDIDISGKSTQFKAAHVSECVSKRVMEETSTHFTPKIPETLKSSPNYEIPSVSNSVTMSSSHSCSSESHKSQAASDTRHKHKHSSRHKGRGHNSSDKSKRKQTASQSRRHKSSRRTKTSSEASSVRKQRAKSYKQHSSTSAAAAAAAISSGRDTSVGSKPLPTKSSNSGSKHLPTKSSDIGSKPLPTKSSNSGSKSLPTKSTDSGSKTLPTKSSDSGSKPLPTKSSDSGSKPSPTKSSDSGSKPSPTKSSDSGSKPSPSKSSDSGSKPSPTKSSDSGSKPSPTKSGDSGSKPSPTKSGDSGKDTSVRAKPFPTKLIDGGSKQLPTKLSNGRMGTSVGSKPLPSKSSDPAQADTSNTKHSDTDTMLSETIIDNVKLNSSTNVSHINIVGPSSSTEIYDTVASKSETSNEKCFRSIEVCNNKHRVTTQIVNSSVKKKSSDEKLMHHRNMMQQPHSSTTHKPSTAKVIASRLTQASDQSTTNIQPHSSVDENNKQSNYEALGVELKPKSSSIAESNCSALEPSSVETPVKSETSGPSNSVCLGEKNVLPLSCQVCHKRCASQSSLNHHMKIHMDRTFKCEICHKAFYSTSNLSQHMTVHTGGNPVQCNICGKTLSCQGKMKVHMRSHTGEKPYECSVCGKRFSVFSSLKSHKIIHNNLSVKCEFCDKVFKDPKLLARHVKIHGERKFDCDVCGKPFKRSAHLKGHMKIHTGQKDFKCYLCDATFSEAHGLKTHMTTHIGGRNHACHVCGNAFSHFHDFMQHMKIHTGAKPFKCDVCPKTFANKQTFNLHMHVHTGERPYLCKICNRTFTQPSHLRTHQRVHSERKHECDKCNRKFIDLKQLESHRKIHTSSRPFKCNVCMTGFFSEETLLRHKQGLCKKVMKQFLCEQCDVRFTTARTLKAHQKRHAQQGEFLCEICTKKFLLLSNLKIHMKKMHNLETFSCDLCKKSFQESESLETHFTDHRKDGGFGCTVCEEIIPDWSDVKSHMKEHGKKSALLKCNKCEQSFTDVYHLKNHERQHDEIKQEKQNEDTRPGGTSEMSTKQKNRLTATGNTETGGTSTDQKNRATIPGNCGIFREQKNRQTIPGDTENGGILTKKNRLTIPAETETGGTSTKQNRLTIPAETETGGTSTKQNSLTIPAENKSGGTSSGQKNRLTIPAETKTGGTSTKQNSLTIPSETKTGGTSTKQNSLTIPGETESGGTYAKQENRQTISGETKTGETSTKQNSLTIPAETENGGTSTKQNRLTIPVETETETGEIYTEQNSSKKSQPGHKKFRCDMCGKFYSDADHLEKHKRRHAEKTEPDQGKTKGSEKRKRVGDDGVNEKSPMAKKRRKETVLGSSVISEDAQICKEKNFSCSVCEKRYSSAAHLEHHMKKHSNSPLKCEHCGRTFSDKSHLKQHEKKHHEKKNDTMLKRPVEIKTHKCDVCEKVFTQKASLLEHTNIHTGTKPFKCEHCDKCFGDNGSLKVHIRRHIGERSHVCEICDKAFYEKRGLNDHLRIHTGERPFKCTYCDKSFSDRNSLKDHLKIHTGTKPHPCDQCQSTFRTSTALKNHKLSHSEERPFKCDICEKCFKSKVVLDDHTKIHIGDYSFKCQQCDKTFTTKARLAAHTVVHNAVRKHDCQNCGKMFFTSKDLKKHMLTHSGLKNYKCEKCGKCFATSSSLNTHVKTHSDDKPYKCQQCNFITRDLNNLKKHELIHTDRTRSFKCDTCEKAFYSLSSLKTHSLTHSEAQPYKCRVCESSFKRRDYLKIHMRLHDQVTLYKCEVCQKTFKQKSNMTTHMISHTGLKRFKCAVCERKFACKQSLDNHMLEHNGLEKPKSECTVCHQFFVDLTGHMKIHTGIKPFQCKLCPSRFNRKDSLRSHMVTHTGVKAHKCDVCSKQFSQKSSLRTHMRFHAGLRNYKCTICDKAFPQSSHLRTHEKRVHKKERNHKCEECNKTFQSAQQLRDHIRTHTGEKPYICTVCHRGFTRSGSLKSHMLVHTGVKSFKCDVCERPFAHASALKVHMRCHTGEKPYTCDQCDAAFSRYDNLKLHTLSHTGERPFPCTVCEKTFQTRSSLKIHMSVHTGQSFRCDICDKIFSSQQTCKAHQRTHTGDLLQCDQCDKTYTNRSSLKQHKLTHSAVQSFECEICGKVMSRADSLHSHMKLHDEKKFKCTECDKMFHKAASLKAHMYKHSPEDKPYACDVCGKRFPLPGSLKVHKVTHLDKFPFQCQFCGKGFTQKCNMKKHIEVCHEEQTDMSTSEELDEEDDVDDEESEGQSDMEEEDSEEAT
ncbi:uncharacterized protein [Haliotis cracherodii]|uniref:uncharacterized protein n=1 Tax=Haliotis cracherodii TaxID=6455 RepID=UPI0039E910D1